MYFRISLFVAATLASSTCLLGETLIPAKHHEWAKFHPGAWKHVRMTRQDLDPQGKVRATSITETTTTLISKNNRSVTLRVDTILELAGRQFAKQPQLVTQGLGGELDGKVVPAKTVGTQSITIAGQNLQSEIRTVTVRDNSCQWTSRVYYCRNTAPYVLKREIISTDIVNDASKFETKVDVVSIDEMIEVKGETKKASQIRTIHTTPTSKTITIEYRCEDVPGGYVSHQSEQFDSEGRIIARSTLELLDYYNPPEEEKVRVDYSPVWPRWYHRRWGR
jgi:hypothetical protein